jgi:hypothetical protein
MARYTCSFIVGDSIDHLQPLVIEILQDSNLSLDVLYYNADYIMAREIPGNVPFSKLVTVEVLIDKTTATETETKMSIVIKNEELPLQLENHCRHMFDAIKDTIENSRYVHLIETLAG